MTISRSAEDILTAIGEAFRLRDAAKIAAQFADDGVFINAIGDLEGDTYRGPAEIRGYFERIFSETPDVAWIARAAPIVIGESRAVTQWCRTATDRNGTAFQWHGVDLYVFREGMIVKKDTYIKNVTR